MLMIGVIWSVRYNWHVLTDVCRLFMHACIRVGVLGHAIRILYILTEDLDDLGDLIGAVFSEEEDAVHNQFAHDASRRPNINFEPVVIASQNQLKQVKGPYTRHSSLLVGRKTKA